MRNQMTSSSIEPGSKYIVKPVFRALRVLQFIGNSPEPVRLKDIVAGLGLHKTTALRYLRTFEAFGAVTRDPSLDLYRIDVRLVGLLNPHFEVERLRLACRPYLEQLRDDTRGTVNLGYLCGMDVLYVDILHGEREAACKSKVGRKDPVHTTALGKSILAFLPSEARSAAMPSVLRKRTDRSLTQKAALTEYLNEARSRGYAEEEGENEECAYCIGAPILSSTGEVLAAISVSAPMPVLDMTWREQTKHLLLGAARRISVEAL